jgi:hypothetical protein
MEPEYQTSKPVKTENPWRDSPDIGSNSFECRFSVYFDRDPNGDYRDLNVYMGVYKLAKYVKHDFKKPDSQCTNCITMAKCNVVIISSQHKPMKQETKNCIFYNNQSSRTIRSRGHKIL